MISNYYKTMTGMQSDTYFTGKLYNKLDAYFKHRSGELIYIASSNQFKTQKRYKHYIREMHNIHLENLKIKRGE